MEWIILVNTDKIATIITNILTVLKSCLPIQFYVLTQHITFSATYFKDTFSLTHLKCYSLSTRTTLSPLNSITIFLGIWWEGSLAKSQYWWAKHLGNTYFLVYLVKYLNRRSCFQYLLKWKSSCFTFLWARTPKPVRYEIGFSTFSWLQKFKLQWILRNAITRPAGVF